MIDASQRPSDGSQTTTISNSAKTGRVVPEIYSRTERRAQVITGCVTKCVGCKKKLDCRRGTTRRADTINCSAVHDDILYEKKSDFKMSLKSHWKCRSSFDT